MNTATAAETAAAPFSLEALEDALDELLDSQDDSMRYDPQRGNHPYYRAHRLVFAVVEDDETYPETRGEIIIRAYIGEGYNYETARIGFLKRTGAVRWVRTSRPNSNGTAVNVRTTNCAARWPHRGVLDVMDLVGAMKSVVVARTARALFQRERDCYSAVSICEAAMQFMGGRPDPLLQAWQTERDDLYEEW